MRSNRKILQALTTSFSQSIKKEMSKILRPVERNSLLVINFVKTRKTAHKIARRSKYGTKPADQLAAQAAETVERYRKKQRAYESISKQSMLANVLLAIRLRIDHNLRHSFCTQKFSSTCCLQHQVDYQKRLKVHIIYIFIIFFTLLCVVRNFFLWWNMKASSIATLYRGNALLNKRTAISKCNYQSQKMNKRTNFMQPRQNDWNKNNVFRCKASMIDKLNSADKSLRSKYTSKVNNIWLRNLPRQVDWILWAFLIKMYDSFQYKS